MRGEVGTTFADRPAHLPRVRGAVARSSAVCAGRCGARSCPTIRHMGGKTEQFQFEASRERLWATVVQCIGTSGYTVIMSDAQSGIVSFNTGRSMKSWGGQDLSATVAGDSESSTLIMGGSLARGGNPFGGGSQVASWGEKGTLIRRFAESVAEALPGVPVPVSSSPTPSADVSAGLGRLAALRESGALTEDEFQAAKAKLLG
jgi:putative oligomerization/nucleic acid binding protein